MMPYGNPDHDGRFSYTWMERIAPLAHLTSLTNAPMGVKSEIVILRMIFRGREVQRFVSTIYTTGTIYTANTTKSVRLWRLDLIAEVAPNNHSSEVNVFFLGQKFERFATGCGWCGWVVGNELYGSATTIVFGGVRLGMGMWLLWSNAADGTVAAQLWIWPLRWGHPRHRADGPRTIRSGSRPKYDDDESDLLYYGYRYYKPSHRNWPIGMSTFRIFFFRMPSFPTALAIQTSDLVGSSNIRV